MRGRDELDGLGGEPIDGARVRRRLGDPAQVVVVQRPEFGEARAGADVVRLGDGVEHFQARGLGEGVDDTLRTAAQRLNVPQFVGRPPRGLKPVGELPGDDAEQPLLGVRVQGQDTR